MNLDDLVGTLLIGAVFAVPLIIVTAVFLRWLFRINHIVDRLTAIQADQKRQADAAEALLKAVAPAQETAKE